MTDLFSHLKYRLRLLKLNPGKKNQAESSSFRIVVYHGLTEKNHLAFNNRFITVKMFEEHLHWYKKNCHVVSLDDIFESRLQKNRLNIALTFDDGYQNNFRHAVPLLEKYNLPAVFFITALPHPFTILWPDLVDITSKYLSKEIVIQNEKFSLKKKEFVSVSSGKKLKQLCSEKKEEFIRQVYHVLLPEWEKIKPNKEIEDFWQLMNADELKSIAENPLFQLGIHGTFHTDFCSSGIRDAAGQSHEAKKYLLQSTGKEPKFLAFPFGNYSREISEALYNEGFTKQLACNYLYGEKESHPVIKNRFIINPFLTTRMQMKFLNYGRYH